MVKFEQMEHTISSLAYKGAINEAIAEAKRQRKLFVVYISGDNAESTRLEELTWTDSHVAELISKYCILLHLSEWSTDATNFCAIYTQKSSPSITAIGYNGLKLWQNEGFVSGDILASSLEKEWLSLHIQETTATFLTAALASKNSRLHSSTGSETVSFEQGSSSSVDVPSTSPEKHGQDFDARKTLSSEMESKGPDHANEEINSEPGDEACPESVFTNIVEGGEVERSIEIAKESLRPVKVDPNDAVREKNVEAVEDDKIVSDVTTETSQVVANEATEAVQEKKADIVERDKIDVLDSCLSKPTDVHVSIRLLDGANLQEKFLLTSTLRMVKDYVDENQASPMGSYDLAIPYPRKVFMDQDLNRTLSELGLSGRQALILVPRHRATGYHRGGFLNQTNSTTDLSSSNQNNEGYFGFAKRILSYLNPFSYLGGGANPSNSAQEAQNSSWQYNPNPALQNDLRGMGGTPTVSSSSQSTPVTGRNNNESKQATSSRLGSNIHTLKRDEDDGRFNERNAFWNGNSTEYGGDNDGK